MKNIKTGAKIKKFTLAPFLDIKEVLAALKIKSVNDDNIIRLWCNDRFSSGILTHRSSLSLRVICELKIEENNFCPINLYLPSYYCNSSLEYVINNKLINIYFYPINQGRLIVNGFLDSLSETVFPDILVHVHYFGIYHNFDYNFSKVSRNTWLVEDAAHCSFSSNMFGKKSDFTLFSPYKILPVPLIGILYCNREGPASVPYNSNELTNKYGLLCNKEVGVFSNVFWLIKKLLFSFNFRIKYKYESFIQIPVESNNFKLNVYSVNRLSKKILYNFLLNKVRFVDFETSIRSLFYEVFNKSLTFSIKNYAEISFSPYFIIIKFYDIVKCEIFYNKMIEKQFLCVIWPDLPNMKPLSFEVGDKSSILRNSCLYIPLHLSHDLKAFKQYLIDLKKFLINEANEY